MGGGRGPASHTVTTSYPLIYCFAAPVPTHARTRALTRRRTTTPKRKKKARLCSQRVQRKEEERGGGERTTRTRRTRTRESTRIRRQYPLHSDLHPRRLLLCSLLLPVSRLLSPVHSSLRLVTVRSLAVPPAGPPRLPPPPPLYSLWFPRLCPLSVGQVEPGWVA